jgi:hypothetical protein
LGHDQPDRRTRTLLDAAYALDELAERCFPDRTRFAAGVRALDSVCMTETPIDRPLLDAANELHVVLEGGATLDLTKNGRMRAASIVNSSVVPALSSNS